MELSLRPHAIRSFIFSREYPPNKGFLFSREQGRVKLLGRGAQKTFSNRVCVYTTQFGF